MAGVGRGAGGRGWRSLARWLLAVLAAVLVAGAPPGAQPERPMLAFEPAKLPAIQPLPATFLRGIALGLYHSEKRVRRSLEAMLDDIPATGATDVSLVVSWAQHDTAATAIAPDGALTLPGARLRGLIRRAHRAGLRVTLFPLLELKNRGPGKWRGVLEPGDRNAWWRAYNAFILHYARIAAEERTAQFIIGSELGAMESETPRWTALAGRVRDLYRGRILYAANWDHYEGIGFWHAVDFAAISAYPKLTESDFAPDHWTLLRVWQSRRRALEAWAGRIGKPLVFTEIGYPSLDGANTRPWDYTAAAPPDPEEQAMCLWAFMKAWEGSSVLHGAFIWNWFGDGGPGDTYYTLRGKPAQGVVERWFRR